MKPSVQAGDAGGPGRSRLKCFGQAAGARLQKIRWRSAVEKAIDEWVCNFSRLPSRASQIAATPPPEGEQRQRDNRSRFGNRGIMQYKLSSCGFERELPAE